MIGEERGEEEERIERLVMWHGERQRDSSSMEEVIQSLSEHQHE